MTVNVNVRAGTAELSTLVLLETVDGNDVTAVEC